MHSFAKFIQSVWVSWTIVLFTVVVAMGSLFLSLGVVQDDDILAFLPEGNEDIRAFQRINDKFGGMDIALVGIEAENPFERAFLERLQTVTDGLSAHEHIDYVLSLTNVEDFTADPMGGVKSGLLISKLPDSNAEQHALRNRVLARDHLVGNVIAKDGKGVLLYAFATYGTDARELATTIRAIVEESFPPEDASTSVYWGGAPFISSYIFETCQSDLTWLSPLAVLIIVFIILVSFRDWVGSAIALFATLTGVFASQAAMAITGTTYNIVLSGMPVILFAVGSAYSIHMLSRYYANVASSEPEVALSRTITETGPVVLAAGFTTIAGLCSFVVMDIAPMRTFGIFTALGIFTTLIVSVFSVPAFIRIIGLKGKVPPEGGFRNRLIWMSTWVHRQRVVVGMGLVVVALLSGLLVGRIDSRVDQSAFFSPNSPPDQAQQFLDDRFGGSQFLQIHLKGALGQANVLREVRRIADEVSRIPGVTDVIHAGDIVALINDAMDGNRRIPDSDEQANTLLRFLSGQRSVAQVITEQRDEALIVVKIGSNTADALEAVLGEVEELLAENEYGHYAVFPTTGEHAPQATVRLQNLVYQRVMALIHQYEATIGKPEGPKRLAAQIMDRPSAVPAALVAETLRAWLSSEECWVELTPELAQKAADAWAALGPEATEVEVVGGLTAHLSANADVESTSGVQAATAEETTMLVQDLIVAGQTQVDGLWRRARAQAHAERLLTQLPILGPSGPKGERFSSGITQALMDLDNPDVILPVPPETSGAQALSMQITGLPQLYRGLSRSVESNQIKSLGIALVLVLIIMTLMFRSVTAGLLATSPTFFTLLVVYGLMGLFEVHLDIGTSMLASLIIGAGVDYAVHLMAAWNTHANGDTTDSLRHAIRDAAPGIWTNALMVAAGFFVLSLGEARPLQNVGLLTATAMLTAAVGTFVAIPVFARRVRYGRANPLDPA